MVLATELETVTQKFLEFTNCSTYCTYNFTLAPDPQGTIYTVVNTSSKYGKDYIKFAECPLIDFQKHVPSMLTSVLTKYFKQYIIYMFLEVGSNGLRHYHGQIVATEPALSDLYFQDLIGNIAFKFTSKFRNTKVLQNHPCIRIYLDNDKWEAKGDHLTYRDYMTKQSQDYYIDAQFLSRYYQDKWLKEKHLINVINISSLIKYMYGSNLLVTKSNLPKIRKCYTNKKEQELETLICLKNMFKYSTKISIEINTDDLDNIL